MRRFLKLHHLILAGIVLGILAGLLLGGLPKGPGRDFAGKLFETAGDLFLRLLTSVMVPLVMASLIGAMLSVGDPRKLGRIGGKAVAFYLASAILAVATALACVNVIRPDRYVTADTKQKLETQFAAERGERLKSFEKVREEFTVWEFVKRLVPKNPVKSMTEDPPDMLAIIVFALMLGLGAALLPETTRRPFAEFNSSLNEVMLRLVQLIMFAAPVGAFALMAKVILKSGVGILGTLLVYMLTVLLAMAIHFFGVYALTVRFLGKMSPLLFWKGMRETMLMGFSTSSSAATLPVNLKAVRENLGVSAPVTNFSLSLGATINMDGTAIFQAVASVFIAFMYGMDLSLGAQLTILVTATLAAIGTAPVPGAGIIMLGVIMVPLGIPLEGIALILGVDRFLDMCRTVLNVVGDAACAVMVAKTEGETLKT